MVIREWRGRVPPEKLDAYIDILHRTGIRDYEATPGNRGVWLLVDRELSEVVLITHWESKAAIQRFAGEDIGKAVYYPEDDGYLIDKPERLRHYDLVSVQNSE